MSVRTPEQCAAEIEVVEEYMVRMFGVELDRDVFAMRMQDLIAEKISDYLYQRFRDWPVQSLRTLVETLKPLKEEAPKEPLRRGRKLATLEAER